MFKEINFLLLNCYKILQNDACRQLRTAVFIINLHTCQQFVDVIAYPLINDTARTLAVRSTVVE